MFAAALSVPLTDWLAPATIRPDVAIILLAVGGLLICVEFNAPGLVVPGATGLFLALLAVFTLLHLPLHASALALIFLSLGLLGAEVKLPAGGMLGILGIAGLVTGLAHLVAADASHPQVSWAVAAGAGIGFGGIATGLAVLGERARRAKVLTGAEAMIDMPAIVQVSDGETGVVLVRGELWKARTNAMQPMPAHLSPVRIVAFQGLELVVESAPEPPTQVN